MGRRQPIKSSEYGKPMHCPHCPHTFYQDERTRVWSRGYYGWLKLPGLKTPKCPNCGSTLVGNQK